MLTQREAAGELRNLADRLEHSAAELALPAESYTLSGAVAAVRNILPKTTLKIELEVWSMAGDRAPTLEWGIWDGVTHFKAKTLTQAVKLCLADHAQPADAIAAAEALLVGAQAQDSDVLAALDFGRTVDQHVKG